MCGRVEAALAEPSTSVAVLTPPIALAPARTATTLTLRFDLAIGSPLEGERKTVPASSTAVP
jgi:hypothetical protein